VWDSRQGQRNEQAPQDEGRRGARTASADRKQVHRARSLERGQAGVRGGVNRAGETELKQEQDQDETQASTPTSIQGAQTAAGHSSVWWAGGVTNTECLISPICIRLSGGFGQRSQKTRRSGRWAHENSHSHE